MNNKIKKKSTYKVDGINVLKILDNGTVIISPKHPLAIAHQKLLKNYNEGNVWTSAQIIEQIKNGTYED